MYVFAQNEDVDTECLVRYEFARISKLFAGSKHLTNDGRKAYHFQYSQNERSIPKSGRVCFNTNTNVFFLFNVSSFQMGQQMRYRY